jgi:hypothetical protein
MLSFPDCHCDYFNRLSRLLSRPSQEALSTGEIVTNSVYLNYNAFAWLAKPPNTLLNIIIEVLVVFYGVCC